MTMTTEVTSPGLETSTEAATPTGSGAKPRAVRLVLPLLVALALGGGAVSYTRGLGKESTDDAQVEGHVASVAPRVAGQVARVLVQDNQAVKAGDVLLELDDRDQQARLAAARADLAAAKAAAAAAATQLALTEKTAEANLRVARGGLTQAASVGGTTRAGIDQAKADVTAARARQALAALELKRAEKLSEDRVISAAELDNRRSLVEQSDAALAQAQARLASAEAGRGNVSGTVEAAQGRLLAAQTGPEQIEAARAQLELARARVEQSEAAARQAELNLSYTKVTAQVAGVVARRTVEPGQLVGPERPLLAIVPLDDTWIVANFKEDQLAHMRPGQPAEITIDTYGGRAFQGTIESLAAGTGSRFSLLPPDNASGNFTKVVQRVPVLIRVTHAPDAVLRPGMSAAVTVRVK